MTLIAARKQLHQKADKKRSITYRRFFKNCQQDIFLGVTAKFIRDIAKEYSILSMNEIRELMKSNVHDERSLAHAILRIKFKKGSEKEKAVIYQFYLNNKKYIRDWDGVDDSAPYIVGPYLLDKEKDVLYELATSKRIWDRRIAMVTTWWFIRQNQFTDTIRIAELLLKDEEDLIHKAVGWMLREMGKRDATLLKRFLKKHISNMPRTALRYAIEKFPEAERQVYLKM